MNRRTLLHVLFIGGPAAALTNSLSGCAPPDDCDPSLPGGEDCSTIIASAGLNQYDVLRLAYQGNVPTDRNFSFAVLRDGAFVEPPREEYIIAPAPDGTATERSFDPDATELYTFTTGETAIFYEVINS